MILQEIAATRDSPDEIAYELLQDAAFPEQAIGRPILGTTESVKSFGAGDLRAFLEANYGAKRMVLSAAGNVDHAELVRHAEAQFGRLNGGVGGRFEPARYVGGTRTSAKPFEQSHLVMAFAGPVVSRRRSSTPPRCSPGCSAGGCRRGCSRRCGSAAASAMRSIRAAGRWPTPGLFGIHAATGPEMMEKLIDVVGASSCVRAAAEKPAEAELARSKAQLKAGLLMGLESSSARAEQMARQLLLFDRLMEPPELIERIDARDGGSGARAGGQARQRVAALGRRRRRRPQGQGFARKAAERVAAKVRG